MASRRFHSSLSQLTRQQHSNSTHKKLCGNKLAWGSNGKPIHVKLHFRSSTERRHLAAAAVQHPGPLRTVWAVRLCEMHCGSLWKHSVTLGAWLVTVRATAHHPLSVGLDLHCALCDSVGVEKQVASPRLDVLPILSTRGRCKDRTRITFGSSATWQNKAPW